MNAGTACMHALEIIVVSVGSFLYYLRSVFFCVGVLCCEQAGRVVSSFDGQNLCETNGWCTDRNFCAGG